MSSKSVVLMDFGTFDKIKVIDWPLVEQCGEYDVVVKTTFCGVNFADLYLRRGLLRDQKPPFVLGIESCGVVSSVGEKVTLVKVNDRVVCYNGKGGLYRKTIVLPEWQCFPIPNDICDQDAVSLPANYLTAYFSLFDIGNLRPGSNILVHSCAGGVGWAATQLARTVDNVTVVGTGSEMKRGYAWENGVNYMITPHNYSIKLEEDEFLKNVKFDIIIDSVGGDNLAVSQRLLKPLGKVILTGISSLMTGKGKFGVSSTLKLWWHSKSVNLSQLSCNNHSIAGFNLRCLLERDPEKIRETMNKLYDMYRRGAIKPRVHEIIPFNDAVAGMKILAERNNIGKVILQV